MRSFNSKKQLHQIIERYIAGEANPDEIRFVEAYYNYLENNGNTVDTLHQDELEAIESQMFQAIQSGKTKARRTKLASFYRYASAAAILIALFGGFYFFRSDSKLSTELATKKSQTPDVLPGSDKAVLTLANGSKVILDQETSANISDEHGVNISKTGDGKLVYTIINNSTTQAPQIPSYNMIETPKGGQYQVLLPDGTKVWLNAASSLRYPEVFAGNKRTVELTGEAYFEVAKNRAKPFHVKSQNQDVEVLGTHFNINSYRDENVTKTTLLEGSIRVSNDHAVKILKPGQQSIVGFNTDSSIQLANDVDTDDETAWKNGLFQFNDSNLKSILNQLERWYDVRIDYRLIPDKRYTGMIPRKVKLTEVLRMLEKTGSIRFEITNDRQLRVLQ